MPILDKPLEELKIYRGCSPKPADYDDFWERALAELKQTDSEVKWIQSDFQTSYAQCYDLYYNGVRGAKIHAKVLLPRNIKENCPALLRFHGYRGSVGNWINLLPYAAAGFVIAGMDCRGQSGESEDVGGILGTTMTGQFVRGLDDDKDNMLMRHIFLDTAQLAGIVMNMPEVDANRVGAFGGSQGGALVLACAGLVPQIRMISAVHPFLCDYKRVWEMDLAKDAYEELRQYFRSYDPLHEREEEIFTKLGYIDVQYMAERVKAKALLGITLMDTICPPSTQYAAYNRITSEKSALVYPDFGHEYLPGHDDKEYQFFTELQRAEGVKQGL